MDDLVLTSISYVFSLSKEEAKTFLQMMATDTKEFPSETYMKDILAHFPPPKYYTNGADTVEENELHVNENSRALGKGEFGYVRPNVSRAYAYKYFQTPMYLNSTNKWIQGQLVEPLINVILQCDPVVKKSICMLYKIYCEKTDKGYNLIYKMQRMGPTLIVLDPFLLRSEDLELNKRVLLKTYGPLYKALAYLRKTYQFEHGDLHSKNLLFRKNPVQSDGTIKESRLSFVKMIDFGYSGMVYNGKLYGYNEPVLTYLKA